MAGDKKPDGSTDAACLALRIATVALSVASAAMMASASQRSCTAAGCSPSPASQQQVSYSDYSSLKYSLAATIVSAAVQAAAACVKARGGGKEGDESKSKAIKSLYELVDAASQVFLYSSSALSFSVDDFGTCGHRVAGVCKGSGEFCQRVRASGILSMAAAVCLAASKYLKDVPVSTWFKSGEKKAKKGCGPRGHCHH
ncbi:unnamed protein product [Urochloa decumbens]|uniref:CASP-like protein n=1 Tax=Urochloa decumbens TaxID=240449 RepID=A0ABC9AT35_9POAL